jgi:hypothetical protein
MSESSFQKNSQQLMVDALKYNDGKAFEALCDLVIAAAHSGAMSGLPFSMVMNLFASQFEIMVDLLKKRDAQGSGTTEEITTTPEPGKSN